MSGHSKWANIKHRKTKTDQERGKTFSKIAREIIVAAREGGGDPGANFRLRLAVAKAKEANMPGESIARAIKRGAGGGEQTSYEEATYEGYGPGGVAILLRVVTDNRNRTASDIRYLFSKHGGNLGEAGCVSWMFNRRGLIVVDGKASNLSEEQAMGLAIDAGAEDFRADGETFEVITSFEDFEDVRRNLESKDIKFVSAEATWIPKTTVQVQGREARQVLSLLEDLEEHDDVGDVHANFEIPDEEMEAMASGR